MWGALIGAVAGLLSNGVKSEAANSPLAHPGMSNLAQLLNVNGSINKNGLIVTMNGSTATATTSNTQDQSPSLDDSAQGGLGRGAAVTPVAAGGIDFNTILIGLVVLAAIKKM